MADEPRPVPVIHATFEPTVAASHAIELRGVRTHNLKDLDIDIPQRSLVVVSGVSGSGKSSLAFDTLYAEGQRRFLESMSTYARQFLQRMEKPPLRSIANILPAVALRQRGASGHARSTVGTITELDEHLQMLYAHIGEQRCPSCGAEVARDTITSIVERLRALGERAKLVVFAHVRPLEGEGTEHLLNRLVEQGFRRFWIDGEAREIESIDVEALLDAADLPVLIDRIVVRDRATARLVEALEQGLELGSGRVDVDHLRDAHRDHLTYYRAFRCRECAKEYVEPIPALFNPNTTLGACPECTGFGKTTGLDLAKVVPNGFRTLKGGAIVPLSSKARARRRQALFAFCREQGVPLDVPWRELGDDARAMVLEGKGRYSGVRGFFAHLEAKRHKASNRILLARYRGYTTCASCQGGRLNDQARHVLVGGVPIHVIYAMTAAAAWAHFQGLVLTPEERAAVDILLDEIGTRLRYMNEVGLGYIEILRQVRSLSGGEFQRLHLTSSIGRALTDTLYVLDEPTAGLHARDSERLLIALEGLRDLGNTVVVVEHDPTIIAGADWAIELGPWGGELGGNLLYDGPVSGLAGTDTPTGRMLAGRTDAPRHVRRPVALPVEVGPDAAVGPDAVDASILIVPPSPPSPASPASPPSPMSSDVDDDALLDHGDGDDDDDVDDVDETAPVAADGPETGAITIVGATHNNLKNVTITIPLRRFVCVTGVSGSGKSTLVTDILYHRWRALGGDSTVSVGACDEIRGLSQVGELVLMDQRLLGRSTRSNSATYTKAYDAIRKALAETREAKEQGITAHHFSFNSRGGRCEVCEGTGRIVVEMQFMADVELQCESCDGRRFTEPVLAVRYRGKNIDDILSMTVREALAFFKGTRGVTNRLEPLAAVGLDYVRLGQTTATLSGGELQRLKLASYLVGSGKQLATQKTKLFIFDEPTVGLHVQDVEVLLGAIGRLVDQGHSVLVVEHNLDFVAAADWVLDLGPEAGDRGGELVVAGPPEAVAACPSSCTGRYLAELFEGVCG